MEGDRRTFAGDQRGLAVERWVIWLVVIVVAASVVGSVVAFGDEVRRDDPDANFSFAFDGETRTLTVEHAGGGPITDRVTRQLSVVVVDESADASSNVTWVADDPGPTSRGTGYPVAPGDSLTIDDPRVDSDGDGNYLDAEASVGFYLEQGDRVRVVWTGNRQGGAARTVTLANATLG